MDRNTGKSDDVLLEEQLANVRSMYNSLPVGILLVDANGRFLGGNVTARETLRVTENELRNCNCDGHTWQTVRPDGSPFPVEEHPVTYTLATGQPMRDVEMGLRFSDGTTWLRINTQPLFSLSGAETASSPSAVIASFADITEWKAAEKRLRISEERFRLTTRAGRTGVWDWDLEENELYLDPAVKAALGYQGHEIANTIDAISEHVHPEDRKKFAQLVEDAIGGRLPEIRMELRAMPREGKARWLLIHGSSICDQERRPIRLVGTLTDVTELKQAEESLRRAHKMEALGQMATGIAHDFNNVLGIILGNVNLIRRDQFRDDRFLNRLKSIEESTRRATELTRKLLDFARRDPARVSVVNLNREIEAMSDLVGRSVTPKIEVEHRLDDTLWSTEIDAGEFQDVLLNLVLNARDAMPQGGRLVLQTLNITADASFRDDHPQVDPGEYATITVTDSGTGIPRSDLDHIFEPFFTTKPKGQGTGLGLATAYGFVGRFGGHIEVESEVGKGTSFTLYFPRAESAETTPERVEQSEDSLPGGHETILVVDDEPELLALAQEFLESLGYRVLMSRDGSEALEQLKRESEIDLLFSDIVMPGGMDGYQLSEKALLLRPALSILLASGHASPSGGNGGNAKGRHDVLAKPYSDSMLAQAVRSSLDTPATVSDSSRPGAGGGVHPASIDLEWTDEMTTGVDSLDDDHRDILDILSRVNQMTESRNDVVEMSAILVELEDYLKSHFQREEAVMKVCEYPDLDRHRAAHQGLLSQSHTMRYQLEIGELTSSTIAELLSEYVVNHLRTMDLAFAPYCRGKEGAIDEALRVMAN